MAREIAQLGNVRDNAGADPELRQAERKVNDLISGSSVSGELLAGLFDYIDLAVSKAVRGVIQEMQGRNQENVSANRAGRGQSAFVHDEQRLADRVAARIRKDRAGIQWSQVDNRGRSGEGGG